MKRWLVGLGAFCLLLALAASAHHYVVLRMIVDTGMPSPWASLATGVVWAGLAAMLLHPFAERALPRSIGRLISLPATTWMGVLFWLLIALGVSELALGVAKGLGALPPLAAADIGRWRAGSVATLVAAAAALATRNALRGPRDVRLEIELARWPRALDGYRIAQISDIHIGPALGRRFARRLVERVNALEADLVAVTGDLVDGRLARLEPEVAPFAELRGRDGVFFVTGNHDFYSGADDWTKHLTKLGIRVLRNEHLVIERGESKAAFVLAGVDDHRGTLAPGRGGEDLGRALAATPPNLPVVLLAHDPSTFKAAHRCGIDLQLSGHTHGGQIWPFRWLVRLAIPFVAGRYSRGEAELYVSCGTGFWGPPMRLGAPAEITEIVLRAPAVAPPAHTGATQ